MTEKQLAIIKCDDFTVAEMEQLRDSLSSVTSDANTKFILVNGDVEPMNERELKEYLGQIVGMIGYELDRNI